MILTRRTKLFLVAMIHVTVLLNTTRGVCQTSVSPRGPDSVEWNQPLAQNYVVVHEVRDLSEPDKWVCVGSPDLLRLPRGRLLASMELWLATPTQGTEGGIDYPDHCKIKASDDGGKTWRQISTNGVSWGTLFCMADRLYMIGNNPHTRSIIIVASEDGGKTWSKPATLFDDSKYHGSATPVLIKNGFVYRAFEDFRRGPASLVIAGDLSKDLLDPGSWRMSNKVAPPACTPCLYRDVAVPTNSASTSQAVSSGDAVGSAGVGQQHPPISTKTPVRNNFLEGNVVDLGGELFVLLRTRIDNHRTASIMSVCRLDDDGKTMHYRFVQFYPMPGGQNKFKIIHDPVSNLYWTCTAAVPNSYQDPQLLKARGFKGNGGNMRRILMLIYSIDGLNWFQAGCVAMSKNPLEAFHYTSQIIDGDDLLVLSRSSIGGKLPYNNHDTNMITLHRVKNFRHLALDLRQDFNASSQQDLPKGGE